MFLIEDTEGNVFGGFLFSPINAYTSKYGRETRQFINDQNCFLFTFKNDSPQKFDVKEFHKNDVFFLLSKQGDHLFNFEYLIKVGFEGELIECKQSNG